MRQTSEELLVREQEDKIVIKELKTGYGETKVQL